ncbi:DUF6625 family protein [Endozoicomonas acroporae]|uniref:DUF6625 family protein n=1 Tax=Endozoicomonas acroporae TaxID=1701104 RepID=UPI0013D8645E|nr:DUF6625 family protein [Endozoicomonas acroporae]
MKQLIIIIPYFGSWPFWFDAFIESCRYNPNVSWLFYTDCGAPQDKPENCSFIELTFDEYKQLVSQRLGINFFPINAYKLCDIKPLLGYIHSSDIKEYSYWAFGDIDVIYGDLLAYYEPLMERYDFISTHITRASGHLCIIKNCNKLNTAFQKVKGWNAVIENPRHQCFDEKHFTKLFIKNKNWPKVLRNIRDKLNPLMEDSFFHEGHTTPNCRIPWHDGTMNFPLWWKWERGKLTNSLDGEKLYPYLHFMYWKGEVWVDPLHKSQFYSLGKTLEAGFYISENGFHLMPGYPADSV